MFEELFMEINRDFFREFSGFRSEKFPPELERLELGRISEPIYSTLKDIFLRHEGTYSKRIETFLGDKNSVSVSDVNTYPFGKPTNNIYRDFFGVCSGRSRLEPVLDKAVRHCELVLNRHEAEERKAVIILTNKWNGYRINEKYFAEFLRYALIENVTFMFLLYSEYAITLIPCLPVNPSEFDCFRRMYLRKAHDEGLDKRLIFITRERQ